MLEYRGWWEKEGVPRFLLRALDPPVDHELSPGVNIAGCNPANRIHLPHPGVSGCHAEIVVREGERHVWVSDLGSPSGIRIGERRIEEGPLYPGEVLVLGDVSLLLVIEADPIRAPASPTVSGAAGDLSPKTLADGSPACCWNPSLPATHQPVGGCQAVIQCSAQFHASSLRGLRLSGKKTKPLLFCPRCDVRCEPIPGLKDGSGRRSGLWARIFDLFRSWFG